jgi:hypothetical protein
MGAIPDNMLYEGLAVDMLFAPPGPHFGDLFQICGVGHPHFPPSGQYHFDRLADLQFSQIDDYFGVQSLADDGDDVVVWLYPLVQGKAVHHNPGPFDGLRLDYSVLRNPARHVAYFLRCVEAFASMPIARVLYASRKIDLGVPPNLAPLNEDIEAISRHWREQGIEPGSHDALTIDY